MSYAFEITAEDVCNVLRMNSMKVANTNGHPFESYAEDVFSELSTEDFVAIESAALSAGDDLTDDQLPAAYDELRAILVRNGILTQ